MTNKAAILLIIVGLALIFTVGPGIFRLPSVVPELTTPKTPTPTPTATPLPTSTIPAPVSLSGQHFELLRVADGLPTSLDAANAGDGSNRMFIATRLGQIRIYDGMKLLDKPFLDIAGELAYETRITVPDISDEVGLHGVAFDPDYKHNGLFYVTYEGKGHFSILARYRVSAGDPNQADPASGQILLRFPHPFLSHTMAQMVFGPDGYLYVGVGDGGAQQNLWDPINLGQRTDELYGSILRIDVHKTDGDQLYGIPPTNPFVGKDGYAPEIFVYGFRNPSRFSFDRLTGDLYIGDVGENRWEEVNIVRHGDPGGENFGWAYYEGPEVYNHDLIRDTYVIPITKPEKPVFPLLVYKHGNGLCAISGGFVYRGSDLPALSGVYLYADLCSGNVFGAQKISDRILKSLGLLIDSSYFVPALAQDERGELYVVDYNSGLSKIVAASGPAVIESAATAVP